MRQLQLTSAALAPHAPLLLEGIGPPDPERASIREAAAALPLRGDVTVLLSPHGTRTGVYLGAAGSLDAAGIPGRAEEAEPVPELARELARVWGTASIEEPLDHGATVAMMLTRVQGPVVVATLADVGAQDDATSARRAIDEGRSFAEALRSLDGSPASFIASAHSGAALTERGPLGLRERARELEAEVREAIETDPARLADLAVDLALESGSCGPGVLTALSALVAGPGEIKAYGAPHGVGYVVASFPT